MGSQEQTRLTWKRKEEISLQSTTTNSLSLESSKKKCPNCGRSYSFKQNLMKHLRLECGGRRSFSCHLCSTGFTQKGSLHRHLMNTHNIFIHSKSSLL